MGPSSLTSSQATGGELQNQLMRFEGRFSSRVSSAYRPLEKEALAPEVRLRATMDELGFLSAALDIAVGSSPEIDLLDMVTMVALGRDASGAYWKAHAPPERARALEEAFDASLDDIRTIARVVLTPDMEKELFGIIGDWRRQHPDQLGVAAVRLSEYTAPAFAAKGGLEKRASSFLSTVRGATRTADDAVLLGGRALYAAQRLPFLVRMHVQAATRDILLDVEQSMNDIEARARSLTPPLLAGLFLAGSGVAMVAAASWLFARAGARRLGVR
jgi:hypothetical protein